MNEPLFFLDMDGPLVDWVAGVARLYGKPLSGRNFDVHTELGISYGQLSKDIRDASDLTRFWLHLPETPWMRELMGWFFLDKSRPDLFILTSPWPGDYNCYSDKVQWIADHTSLGSDRVIPFPHKAMLAGPNRILIDDHPGHVKRWRLAGGTAVLFPCAHNELSKFAFDPLPYVHAELCKILSNEWSGTPLVPRSASLPRDPAFKLSHS